MEESVCLEDEGRDDEEWKGTGKVDLREGSWMRKKDGLCKRENRKLRRGMAKKKDELGTEERVGLHRKKSARENTTSSLRKGEERKT